MAPEENDKLKPLSAKPLGYFLAILGGFFTAGPLGLVVSPLALMAIAKVQKRDSEKPPNRFLTWALVGIIGAPICGAVSFFGGTALVALTAPKGVESTEYTLWTGVADTKNLKYYYRVYENPAIYELDLNDQDPTGAAFLIDNRPSNAPIVTVPAQFT